MKYLNVLIVSLALFFSGLLLDCLPGSWQPSITSQAHAYYGTGRRITRRTARRTARRVSRRNNYYGSGAVYAAPVAAAGIAIGTVLVTLPQSCSTVTVNGVTYYNCGGTYYQAAYDGPNLVYVVVQPPM